MGFADPQTAAHDLQLTHWLLRCSLVRDDSLSLASVNLVVILRNHTISMVNSVC